MEIEVPRGVERPLSEQRRLLRRLRVVQPPSGNDHLSQRLALRLRK
jgi:hypothetical protein